MHGPGPSSLNWYPTFKRPIQVVDGVAKTLGLLKRPIWKRARDIGLSRWCIPFSVTVGAPTLGVPGAPPVIPGAIHLVRDGDPNDEFNRDAAHWLGNGSVAYFIPNMHWWRKEWFTTLVYLVTHEVGHCLGLAHGGGGVMSGNLKPNDHDIESLKAFYT